MKGWKQGSASTSLHQGALNIHKQLTTMDDEVSSIRDQRGKKTWIPGDDLRFEFASGYS